MQLIVESAQYNTVKYFLMLDANNVHEFLIDAFRTIRDEMQFVRTINFCVYKDIMNGSRETKLPRPTTAVSFSCSRITWQLKA